LTKSEERLKIEEARRTAELPATEGAALLNVRKVLTRVKSSARDLPLGQSATLFRRPTPYVPTNMTEKF
jgi:hypothetical protein